MPLPESTKRRTGRLAVGIGSVIVGSLLVAGWFFLGDQGRDSRLHVDQAIQPEVELRQAMDRLGEGDLAAAMQTIGRLTDAVRYRPAAITGEQYRELQAAHELVSMLSELADAPLEEVLESAQTCRDFDEWLRGFQQSYRDRVYAFDARIEPSPDRPGTWLVRYLPATSLGSARVLIERQARDGDSASTAEWTPGRHFLIGRLASCRLEAKLPFSAQWVIHLEPESVRLVRKPAVMEYFMAQSGKGLLARLDSDESRMPPPVRNLMHRALGRLVGREARQTPVLRRGSFARQFLRRRVLAQWSLDRPLRAVLTFEQRAKGAPRLHLLHLDSVQKPLQERQ